ncbi:MAG: hypothetical protein KDA58_12455, partial [Planctomycetaceae bacterium]|nr:hypothetical protein [Planctomycetaceae bacterium]
PLPGPRMFTPKFTLITYDNPKTEIMAETHMDQVIPDALPQIRAIERANLLSSVGIYQEVPPLVAPDEEQQPWIYGVATWQGVDPDTDFFKVIASGFSNGYELKPGTDGTPVAWRRVIVQKFARPGDRFDPNQKEFAFDGKAMWMTQPDGN